MLISLSLLSVGALYTFDADWKPAFPVGSHGFSGVAVHEKSGVVYVTQRANVSVPPVHGLDTKTGELLHSFGGEQVAIDKATGTWGAHGIGVTSLGDGGVRVFINDFYQHTLTTFDSAAPAADFTQTLLIGTPGTPGVGLNPVQFDALADTAIIQGSSPRKVFVSDGDGGTANRVVALEVTDGGAGAAPTSTLLWASPQRYNNPHSIAYHERTGLLMVADRQHNHTRLVRSSDGVDLGIFDCGLTFGGAAGVPFGVRFYQSSSVDLAAVCSMDGRYIAILDVSDMKAEGPSASTCKILQTIQTPSEYSGPHFVDFDPRTGDLYVAAIADVPKSAFFRYKFNSQ